MYKTLGIVLPFILLMISCKEPKGTSEIKKSDPNQAMVQQSDRNTGIEIKINSYPRNTANYTIQTGLILDFEDIRPLIEQCTDIDRLESIRSQLERATDLEQYRQILEQMGLIEFRDCPRGISGYGITQNP